jgi:hypothetical protein
VTGEWPAKWPHIDATWHWWHQLFDPSPNLGQRRRRKTVIVPRFGVRGWQSVKSSWGRNRGQGWVLHSVDVDVELQRLDFVGSSSVVPDPLEVSFQLDMPDDISFYMI